MSPRKTVILVVEDHPIVRACMAEALIEAGFEAVTVRSATDAIAVLEARTDVKLVFTETEIPRTMDGLKLAQCICDRWPPVMLIVASAMPEVVRGELPEGTRFFPKPYHDAAIVAEMAGMLFPA
jgi:CheY-like chemotaxis protein